MHLTEYDNEPDKWFLAILLVAVLVVLLMIGSSLFAQSPPQASLERFRATPMISWTAYVAIEGFDPIMAKLIECESSWNEEAKGDLRNGKYMAYGLLQFWESTFELYKNKYNLPELEYKNPDDQITLAGIMIKDGHESNWTCWKYVKI